LGEQYLPDPLWRILRSEKDLVSRMSEVDIRSYMLDDILVKVDRMSMAHSLEVRSPLLDHHVVELAARMPIEMKLRGSIGKYVLRQAIAKQLPPQTMRKPKQGFSVPLRDWFRGRLRGLVRDYLGPGGYLPRELFRPERVEKTLDEHQRGTVDHARKIWLLLMFAAWHRQSVGPG
jgi:asparagine synthase (glutamine-hydrolysing)